MKLTARVLAVVVVGTAAAAVPAPALATHPHVLTTPGSCVDKGGAGFGTGETHDDQSFHARVHKGTPGTFAFNRPNNPVAVTGHATCDS